MIGKRRVCAAILVAVGAVASEATVARADSPEPFRASYSGSVSFASDGHVHLDGTGIATHLGASSVSSYIEVIRPAECPDGFVTQYFATLTAANGDTVSLLSDDVGCPTSPGDYYATGRWHITGGTGRFSQTTGSGETYAHVHVVPGGQFVLQLSGSVSSASGG
jgi:hypothetical protein